MATSDPISYAALEEAYSLASQSDFCDHPKATVTEDSGVYAFDCGDCGRHGMADEKAARRLGWIE